MIKTKSGLQITSYYTVLEMLTIVVFVIVIIITVVKLEVSGVLEVAFLELECRQCLLDGVSNKIQIFLRRTGVVNQKIPKLLQVDDV